MVQADLVTQCCDGIESHPGERIAQDLPVLLGIGAVAAPRNQLDQPFPGLGCRFQFTQRAVGETNRVGNVDLGNILDVTVGMKLPYQFQKPFSIEARQCLDAPTTADVERRGVHLVIEPAPGLEPIDVGGARP